MPVIIENLSPPGLPDDQFHFYRVRVNGDVIAHFRHRRSDGLAECLRVAADYVDREGQGLKYMHKRNGG